MAACGPKLRFAAAQRYDRSRWKTGRSMDVAGTAGFDPDPTFPSRGHPQSLAQGAGATPLFYPIEKRLVFIDDMNRV
jgi:hypothetical protein